MSPNFPRDLPRVGATPLLNCRVKIISSLLLITSLNCGDKLPNDGSDDILYISLSIWQTVITYTDNQLEGSLSRSGVLEQILSFGHH